jgi:hypothetical protein
MVGRRRSVPAPAPVGLARCPPRSRRQQRPPRHPAANKPATDSPALARAPGFVNSSQLCGPSPLRSRGPEQYSDHERNTRSSRSADFDAGDVDSADFDSGDVRRNAPAPTGIRQASEALPRRRLGGDCRRNRLHRIDPVLCRRDDLRGRPLPPSPSPPSRAIPAGRSRWAGRRRARGSMAVQVPGPPTSGNGPRLPRRTRWSRWSGGRSASWACSRSTANVWTERPQ